MVKASGFACGEIFVCGKTLESISLVGKALLCCDFHVACGETRGGESFRFLWRGYACGDTWDSSSVVRNSVQCTALVSSQ